MRVVRGKLDGSWRIGTIGKNVMHWWMEDGVFPGQLTFSDACVMQPPTAQAT